MLQFAVTLLQWLPRLFVWLVAPMACFSTAMALSQKSRLYAALGFMVAASVSAIFLAMETAALAYICCDQARMLFSILLDFRPGVTIGFALALLGSVVKPLVGVLPMLVGAAATGTGAFLLRRGSGISSPNPDQLAVIHEGRIAS